MSNPAPPITAIEKAVRQKIHEIVRLAEIRRLELIQLMGRARYSERVADTQPLIIRHMKHRGLTSPLAAAIDLAKAVPTDKPVASVLLVCAAIEMVEAEGESSHAPTRPPEPA